MHSNIQFLITVVCSEPESEPAEKNTRAEKFRRYNHNFTIISQVLSNILIYIYFIKKSGPKYIVFQHNGM